MPSFMPFPRDQFVCSWVYLLCAYFPAEMSGSCGSYCAPSWRLCVPPLEAAPVLETRAAFCLEDPSLVQESPARILCRFCIKAYLGYFLSHHESACPQNLNPLSCHPSALDFLIKSLTILEPGCEDPVHWNGSRHGREQGALCAL